MAVRVEVKIKAPEIEKTVSTVAVANAGFETDSLELIIPLPLSLKLGLSTKGARKEIYRTAGGFTTLHKIQKPLEVQVITGDRKTDSVKCFALISEIEDEVVLSDKLISKFRIVLEDVGGGLWRFRDESGARLRKSKKPQRW